MNLYLYDEKHERVSGSIDLGEAPDCETIDKVISFLDKNGVTSRYNRLVVAKSYAAGYDEENDYSEIIFEF